GCRPRASRPTAPRDRCAAGDLPNNRHHARHRGIHPHRDRRSPRRGGRNLQEPAVAGPRATPRRAQRPGTRRVGIMKEDRFEALMRDAARTYRKPPQPDLDGMWSEIERESWGAVATTPPARIEARWFGTRASGWLAAATLVIGIGLGRASTVMKHDAASAKPQEVASNSSMAPVRSDT